MLWLTIAGLTVLAVVIVLVELLTAAGWMAAATTVEQVDRQGAAEPYEGKHRAPDPEATTVPIERAAYWPPEADLIRPYAAVGGPR